MTIQPNRAPSAADVPGWMTKAELAALVYPHVAYDTSLPDGWVEECRSLGVDPIRCFAWGYPSTFYLPREDLIRIPHPQAFTGPPSPIQPPAWPQRCTTRLCCMSNGTLQGPFFSAGRVLRTRLFASLPPSLAHSVRSVPDTEQRLDPSRVRQTISVPLLTP
jgi:hypothetical protein